MGRIIVGEHYATNEGGMVEVVKYDGCNNITVKHIDKYGHCSIVQASNLRRGMVKNPYHPSVFGVGFIGVGKHRVSNDRVITEVYNVWNGVLERGYCKKFKAKYPTYAHTTVCEEWHNFQVFAEWYEAQYKEDGWQIDKDILKWGNKLYSPENCRMIPHELNILLTLRGSSRGCYPIGVSASDHGYYVAQLNIDGIINRIGTFPTPHAAFIAYKREKEGNIRRMANRYKSVICLDIYNALMAFDITEDM